MEVKPQDQTFTLDEARLMVQGKFHEEDQDDKETEEEIS